MNLNSLGTPEAPSSLSKSFFFSDLFVVLLQTNLKREEVIFNSFKTFLRVAQWCLVVGGCTFGYQVERKSNPAPNLLLFVFAHTPDPAQDGLGKELIYLS